MLNTPLSIDSPSDVLGLPGRTGIYLRPGYFHHPIMMLLKARYSICLFFAPRLLVFFCDARG